MNTTLKEENQRRAKIRTVMLAIGTPLLVMIGLACVAILGTLVNTSSAVKSFTAENANYEQIFKSVELSAITAPFMEEHVAKYNFATALAKADPTRREDSIMIYLQIIPQSPPNFVCYPVLNASYYSEMVGDEYALSGNLQMAELFYNYAEHYLSYAPQCVSSPPPDSSDQQDEQDQEDKGEAMQERVDELAEKQKQIREAQGKPEQSETGQSEKEDQIKSNTEKSEKTQKETEQIREEQSNGEMSEKPLVDRPW